MADLSTLGDAAKGLAEQITALGVTAVVDQRDLNLPACWVTPGAMEFDYLDGTSFDMAWDVYLIAPDNGTPEALNVLGAMLTKLVSLGFSNVQPVTLNLPNHSADPLPALLLSINTQITEDS